MAEDVQLLELREMDLEEHQLSVDTTVRSGLSDEARRNADLNTRMLHDAAVAAGGENALTLQLRHARLLVWAWS